MDTGVGCHFLLQCMKVKSESEVAQSCPTPSDPMDCSLPGSSVHGIFQQEYWSGVSDSFVTLWTVARQTPLSVGFPRREYWSGLPFPSPADLPKVGTEPTSPGGFLTSEPPGKPEPDTVPNADTLPITSSSTVAPGQLLLLLLLLLTLADCF